MYFEHNVLVLSITVILLQVRVADKVMPQMAWLNDDHKVSMII